MVDLKSPKWEDFHISKSMRRERRPGEKVRCGIYRAKPGSPRPEYKQHRIVKLPEGFFNGQIQTGVHRESDTYMVHIGLSNGELITEHEVYCSDIDDYDLLLGMDIITQTDFLITNKDGRI